MEEPKVSVVIVDDNAVVRMGLRSLMGTHDRIEVIGEASDGLEAVEQVKALNPDVVLCDVRMPRASGIDVARTIASMSHLVMLTSVDEPAVVHAAIDAGARGYLVYTKDTSDEIAATVLAVARGATILGPEAAAALTISSAAEKRQEPSGWGLSPRENEIMGLIVQGRSNREIATEFFLAEKTVKNHINRIFGKLGVTTRAEAIVLWGPGGS